MPSLASLRPSSAFFATASHWAKTTVAGVVWEFQLSKAIDIFIQAYCWFIFSSGRFQLSKQIRYWHCIDVHDSGTCITSSSLSKKQEKTKIASWSKDKWRLTLQHWFLPTVLWQELKEPYSLMQFFRYCLCFFHCNGWSFEADSSGTELVTTLLCN